MRATTSATGGSGGKFKVAETDLRLRDDVRMLGAVLGNAIKLSDPKVFEAVEKLRKLGREVSFASLHHPD